MRVRDCDAILCAEALLSRHLTEDTSKIGLVRSGSWMPSVKDSMSILLQAQRLGEKVITCRYVEADTDTVVSGLGHEIAAGKRHRCSLTNPSLQMASLAAIILQAGIIELGDKMCIGRDRQDVLGQLRRWSQIALQVSRRLFGTEHLRTAHAMLSNAQSLVLVAIENEDLSARLALFQEALQALEQVSSMMVSLP